MEIPVAIAPLNGLGMFMVGDSASQIARETRWVTNVQLAAHIRHHAQRDRRGIGQKGAQKADGPELEGKA